LGTIVAGRKNVGSSSKQKRTGSNTTQRQCALYQFGCGLPILSCSISSINQHGGKDIQRLYMRPEPGIRTPQHTYKQLLPPTNTPTPTNTITRHSRQRPRTPPLCRPGLEYLPAPRLGTRASISLVSSSAASIQTYGPLAIMTPAVVTRRS